MNKSDYRTQPQETYMVARGAQLINEINKIVAGPDAPKYYGEC